VVPAGTILIVDDEPVVRDVVARYLDHEGFTTVQTGDGTSAKALLEVETPALVVLDLMLPGLDGLTLCRWIRARSDVPVILLTARSDEADRITGLELGADDYVTKPFSPRELAVRVATVLRRATGTSVRRAAVCIGPFDIDPTARTVTREGERVRMAAKEFDLLWLLASNPGEVFPRDVLMRRVWGYESSIDTGTLTVHVRRLREKIEDDPSAPRHLETVWGIGYRLRP
jgi:two-component system, OmpR family, response regulator ResD